MSNLWRSGEQGDGRMDVGENPVGGIDVVLCDVFPNLVEIRERIRMEGVAAHPPDRRRSLFSRSFEYEQPGARQFRAPRGRRRRLSHRENGRDDRRADTTRHWPDATRSHSICPSLRRSIPARRRGIAVSVT